MARNFSLLAVFILLLLPSFALAAEKKVIIGFHHNPKHTEMDKRDRVHRAGGRIKRVHAVVDAVSATLPEEAIAALKNDPEIAYVEEDRIFSIKEPTSTYVPSAEYVDSWGVLRIGADVSARNGIKGAGVKVAILDSGIDYSHPDLKDNYQGGYDFIHDNNDPFDDSKLGHGTHVAGIIAAKDNGTGVVGVAPDASIYAVKVLDEGLFGSTSALLAGIEWAITNKMNIINMSFGIPFYPMFYSQALDDACAKAYSAGIIIVAAAGNSPADATVDYPAAFDSVIAVSATANDEMNTLASYSSYGAKVEVAAPGSNIRSTVPGGGYALLSGTSQAAPHVAGVAALMLSAGTNVANPEVNIVEDIRQRLHSTALDLGTPGRDDYFGFGLVEAPKGDTVAVPNPRKPRKTHALTSSLIPWAQIRENMNHGWEKLLLRNTMTQNW